MDIKLLIVGGKANKSQVAVKLPTVIGRSREADLTVAHPMISRKHCELYEVNGLLMVRDLGSLNGLFVGGRQVNEAALHPNAEFTIGPLTFRVEYRYSGQVAVAPDATTIDESLSPPQPAAGAAGGDSELVAQPEETPPAQGFGLADPTPRVQEEPAEPADIAATIAPPDGQLPDFSAWGIEGARKRPQERAQQPPSPPPPLFAEEPPSKEGPGEATEDGMFDLSPPPAPETDQSDDTGTGDEKLDEFLKGIE